MKNVLKKMEELHEKLGASISKREEQFENRSEKWQESEKGEQFEETTGRLQEMFDELEEWEAELGS